VNDPVTDSWGEAQGGAIGRDGVFTFLLAGGVFFATGGLTWLAHLRSVTRTAHRTGCDAPPLPIVVLGMRLRDGAVLPDFACRLERARALATDRPELPLLILGGHTDASGISEAEAGRDYLVARGLDRGRIHLEDRSRHTLENLQNARRLFGRLGWPAVTLVTSRSHLARAVTIARGLGLDVRPCAAEAQLADGAAARIALAREAFLVHWYWVGRRWSEWTGNRKSLARIR
jgi:uncharacterized SAM-binding protein YcdF (DUF218 family)